MAEPIETNRTYEEIDQPYNTYLERSDQSVNNGSVETQPVKSDGAMADVWIKNFIRSENWKPKSVGFYIDGQTGYAEFMNVFVSGDIQAVTGTIGGFTIGATDLSATSGGNTTILSSGATAFSAGPTGTPTVTITQAGVITATGAIIDGTSTLGGRLASTLATAINSSGNFVDANLNTSAKTILQGFTFGSSDYSGAFKSGTITWNASTGAVTGGSGIIIYKAGIVGATGGTVTFTIDGTTGSATFAGSLTAATGTIGTITLDSSGYIRAGQTGYDSGTGFFLGYSGGVPKFSIGNSGGNKMTWDGSNITVTGNITGSTITGSTLTTASSGQRTVLTSTTADYYDSGGTKIVSTYATGGAYVIQGQVSTSNIYIDAGTTGVIDFLANGVHKIVISGNNSAIYPFTDGDMSLGSGIRTFLNLYLSGDLSYSGVIQPRLYHGYVSGTSITDDNTLFSAANPSTGRYTITHNFGTTGYTVTATALRGSGAGAYIAKIESRNSNDFKVTIFDENGTVQDSDFMFLLCYLV